MFSYIGYVEQGIAKAISSKRADKRFVGEVMDDDIVGLTQDEN
jgi:hypothetical protein